MSGKNDFRVKEIRQKTSSSGANPEYLSVPIGSEGMLIDMISSLDLEEQLRLGGNHYTEIKINNTNTEIYEWYFKSPKGDKTISEMDANNLITYSGVITLENYYIIYPLTDEENNNLIVDTASLDNIVNKQYIEGSYKIIMKLYLGNFQTNGTLLHSKYTIIKKEPSGSISITENLDYEEDNN